MTEKELSGKIEIQREYHDTNFITGLRAIAILLVFTIHSGGGGLRKMGNISNFFVDAGKYGVEIFFVISGYTIFNQLFARNYDWRKFLYVRISRISIPYFPILVLIFFYLKFNGKPFNGWSIHYNNGQISFANLLAHFTYLSPYFEKYQNSILGVEWTLGVEVFFYLLFALLVKTKLFILSPRSFIIFGIVFFFVSGLLLITTKALHLNSTMLYFTPINYGYMFFLGGLAYYLRTNIKNTVINRLSVRRLVSVGSLILIVGLFALSGFTQSYLLHFATQFSFIFVTFAIIVLFNNKSRLALVLNNKVLIFLGSISYSFYLIHYLVIFIMPSVLSETACFFVKLLISVIISFFWYMLFEKWLYSRVKRYISKL